MVPAFPIPDLIDLHTPPALPAKVCGLRCSKGRGWEGGKGKGVVDGRRGGTVCMYVYVQSWYPV